MLRSATYRSKNRFIKFFCFPTLAVVSLSYIQYNQVILIPVYMNRKARELYRLSFINEPEGKMSRIFAEQFLPMYDLHPLPKSDRYGFRLHPEILSWQ